MGPRSRRFVYSPNNGMWNNLKNNVLLTINLSIASIEEGGVPFPIKRISVSTKK